MDPAQLTGEEALDAALQAGFFLLFKHSPICPISARAFAEYRAFVAENPGIATAWLDVIGQRPLSRRVESRTGVRHESPQVLLIKDGAVAWSATHAAITSAALNEAYGGSAS